LLGFREVAGLRARSGGRVRPGLLYRSGTPQFLDLAAGRRLLAETGIASTIDLRLPHEADQEGTVSVLLHCTVGKDRTGAVVALLLDALGVCREDIAADYARGASDAAEAMARLRSMVSYGDAVDLYPPEALTAEPGTIHRFLAGVDDRHGGSRAFLRDHGLTPAMLDDLDALLVTPPG
jgi:hypothetical protein